MKVYDVIMLLPLYGLIKKAIKILPSIGQESVL